MAQPSGNNLWGPVEQKDKKRITMQGMRSIMRIFSYLRPYKTKFYIGIVALLLSSFTTMSFPFFMGKLIDTSSSNAPESIYSNTNAIALILVGILIFQSAVSYFRVYLFAIVSEKSMADVRTSLYNKLITLSIPFFEEHRVGELTSRSTNDVDQLQDMLSSTLPEFVRQIVTIIFGLGFIFFISPKLTLLMISTFPVLIILAVLYGKYIRTISKKRQDALAESNVAVEETLQNIFTVKAFSNENYESKRYKGFLERVVETGIKGAMNRGAFTTFLILGLFGGFVLVLWYGTLLMKEGEITAGTLTAFMLYTGFIGGAVGGLGEMYGRLQKTVGATERIFEIIEEEGEITLDSDTPKTKLQGSIQFKNVAFTYPTRKDIRVLQDINIQIAPGEKVALAGPSGAGKSTIAQLILRFYEPAEGALIMDGKNANTYTLKELRNNMAIVPQEVILFGGTIKENIAYGKPDANEQEIMEASKKANAWEFISRFPEQLETIVGERGVKLSGGQRQRIAIARAILKDPAILILDEATSSLDAESEKLVQDALEILMENRTTIIIAHRLSTIRNVDRIFVLENGAIKEEGTFDMLSKIEDGIFSNLLKLQFSEKEIIN
ncbi:MAG: ATP-binding cassette domain-containing protein [Chitinophagales bacterium]|nr:ATP-binding cassette domain-containing protein [Bacteroidota bacterium]MBP7400126.1 ATP-binding cassette domain-containing protein [Chitinophagales bacterium]MBP8754930.1 ATP-binding cassette domain-containing protein [Chitinophagales bacterium]MBP9190436.1 ATP-binding cassette domain-containing protein [Chitinophagales bacterium]MBP9705586.1 ATP-binding cassette domain-containing protein [Chitinophagales bacterium]